MKKRIFLIALIVILFGVNIAKADVSAPNFFKKIGNNVNFIQSVMELGSSSARVAKGWFTNLDATNATIGTLQISSSVDPGPLSVAVATNPTIRFKTDTDSGIGWLAANKMSLMTNNTDRLTVDATGNVGIGTTSPTDNLTIKASGAGTGLTIIDDGAGTDTLSFNSNGGNGSMVSSNRLRLQSGAYETIFWTNSLERMRITSDGNVGIGTTSPGQALDVNGNGVFGTGTRTGGAELEVTGTNPQFLFRRAALANSARMFFMTGGTYNWNFGMVAGTTNFGIRDEVNSQNRFSASIGSVAGGVFVDGTTGNVGIGTTAPGQKLEINGGLRLNTATAKPTCSSTTRGTIWHVFGVAGVADTVETCVKDNADAYAWKTLY